MKYENLRKLIRKKLQSESNLAKLLGISKASLSLKLNEKRSFLTDEIPLICKILKIKDKDIALYFFS